MDVTPSGHYSLSKFIPEGLQLGFASVDTREIRRGVRELAIALEEEKQDSHLQASRCSPLSDANCRVTLTTFTYFSLLTLGEDFSSPMY